MTDIQQYFNELNLEIINCRKCPRLVEKREKVARIKKKAFINWDYWGKPVPGFGDITGKILVLGLAPGAHGSNRTGRMFTGDASGNFLYPALYETGFANQSESLSVNDGLKLNNIFISAVCRCVPPDNKPAKEEIVNCRPFINREIKLMKNLEGIIALGKIAFDSAVYLFKDQYELSIIPTPKFVHGNIYFSNELIKCPWLLASYHPSAQNTQTRRLTMQMFQEIWRTANKLLENNF
jgi:uracil-DNA glycosylase family 4